MIATSQNYEIMLHDYKLKKVVKEEYSEPRIKVKGRWGFFGWRLDTVYEKDLLKTEVSYEDTGVCQICGKEKDYWWHDLNFQFIRPVTHRHQWEEDWLDYQSRLTQ